MHHSAEAAGLITVTKVMQPFDGTVRLSRSWPAQGLIIQPLPLAQGETPLDSLPSVQFVCMHVRLCVRVCGVCRFWPCRVWDAS